MPNFVIFGQIRNHQRAELGICPIPGNVFKERFSVKKKIWRPLKNVLLCIRLHKLGEFNPYQILNITVFTSTLKALILNFG